MTYKNSKVGEFSEPKSSNSSKDVIDLINGKSLSKKISTMFFGNNTKREFREDVIIEKAYSAEANIVDGEIRPINGVEIEPKGGVIPFSAYTEFTPSEPMPPLDFLYNSKTGEYSYLIKERNGGGGDGEAWSPATPRFITITGRALDSIPAKTVKSINNPFDFGVSSSFKVSIPIELKLDGEQDAFRIAVPKIPVYAKVTSGTHAGRNRRASTKNKINMPLMHLTFPCLYQVLNNNNGIAQEENVGAGSFPIIDMASNYNKYSKRIFFENNLNGRKSIGTISTVPFLTDFNGNNFKDEVVIENNDTEVIYGLNNYTMLRAYNENYIKEYSEEAKVIMPMINYGGFYDEEIVIEDNQLLWECFGGRDFIAKNMLDLPTSGSFSQEIYEAMRRSDGKIFGSTVYNDQKCFLSDIEDFRSYGSNTNGDPGINHSYILEITYDVVTVNKASNTLKSSEQNGIQTIPTGINIGDIELKSSSRFSHSAEQLISIIPSYVSLSKKVNDSLGVPNNENNVLPEVKVNMQMASTLPPIKNVTTDDVEQGSTIGITTSGFVMYLSEDSMERIYGIIETDNDSRFLTKVFPIYDNQEYSVFCDKFIPLEDGTEFIRTKSFNLLYDDGYNKTVHVNFTGVKENGEENDYEYILVLSNIEMYPLSQLNKTGISNKILFTAKPYSNDAVKTTTKNISLPSKFCSNNYAFSSVVFGNGTDGYPSNDEYFRKMGAISMYQKFMLNEDGQPLTWERDSGNNETDDIYEFIAEYRSFHLEKTLYVYSQQANLSLLLGDNCFCDRIDTGSTVLSIGESDCYFSPTFYSKGVGVYTVSNNIKTAVDVDILPVIYPLPNLFNNNKEHSLFKVYVGIEDNTQAVYNSKAYDGLSIGNMYEYLYDFNNFINEVPVIPQGNFETAFKVRLFFDSIFVNTHLHAQMNSHMLGVNLDNIETCSNIISYLVEAIDIYSDERLYQNIMTPFTGCIVVSKAPRVIEGGALESINDPTSFLGVDLTSSDLLYGLSNVAIDGDNCIVNHKYLYKASNYFINTSSMMSKRTNDGVGIFQNQVNIAPFLFSYDDDSGFSITYLDRNVKSQIFLSSGKLFESPIQVKNIIYFTYIFNEELYFCTIAQNKVEVLSIVKLSDLFGTPEYITEFSTNLIRISSLDYPFVLCKCIKTIDNISTVKIKMFRLFDYGISEIDGEVDFSYIVTTTYLGISGAPLFVDGRGILCSVNEKENESGSLTISSAPFDLRSYGEYIFIPTGLEIFFDKIDGFVDMDIITSINNYFSKAEISTPTRTVVEANGSVSKVTHNFVLDSNNDTSFYIVVSSTGLKLRNISVLGYVISKD